MNSPSRIRKLTRLAGAAQNDSAGSRVDRSQPCSQHDPYNLWKPFRTSILVTTHHIKWGAPFPEKQHPSLKNGGGSQMLAKVDEKEEKRTTLDLSVCRSGKGQMCSLWNKNAQRENNKFRNLTYTHRFIYVLGKKWGTKLKKGNNNMSVYSLPSLL